MENSIIKTKLTEAFESITKPPIHNGTDRYFDVVARHVVTETVIEVLNNLNISDKDIKHIVDGN